MGLRVHSPTKQKRAQWRQKHSELITELAHLYLDNSDLTIGDFYTHIELLYVALQQIKQNEQVLVTRWERK